MAEGIASVTKERAVAADAGPVLARWTAPDALSNLVSVLELAADGQVRYSAGTRRPTAATVKLVEDVLVAGDFYDSGEPIAAFAWPLLIQVGGLGRLASTRLELSPRGRAALARPSYEVLGALWARWLGSVSTDELARIEAIKGQRKPGTLTSAITRRAAVAAALTALQPGVWTGAGKLLASLRAQQPPLVAARSLRALWRLYVVDSYFGSLGHAGSRTWDLVEGRYALCVLFEYAATLGLIDVAYTDPRGARDDYRALWGADQLSCLSRYDGLSAVRVNELGAAVLHDPDALPGLGLPVPRRA
ncbi:MAG TPA: hypothetical protein VJ418_09580 [Streptosporangiaceae bacterium]|nr:hypothetical protein [Streptosporangiaceae bacterium]